MIKIDSVKEPYGYNVKVLVDSNIVQLTSEVKTFIEGMLKEQSELMNAVISELMPMITESTYNMDPDKFRMYAGIVEDML